MSYLDQVTNKRQTVAQTTKEQSELGVMLAELKKMQMAALMGSQGKSTVILTDQTDLGDKLKEMNAKVIEAITSLDSKTLDKEQLSAVRELKQGLQGLKSAIEAKKQDNSDIIGAIKSLKLDTVVNVPEPKVTVTSQPIDFKPLQDTIREAMIPRSVEAVVTPVSNRFDLARYKAVDIKDSDDKQYVGFVNPEGNWYIIENKIRENSMRFVFGASGYSTHFKNAAQYQYKLLDKAITSATV